MKKNELKQAALAAGYGRFSVPKGTRRARVKASTKKAIANYWKGA